MYTQKVEDSSERFANPDLSSDKKRLKSVLSKYMIDSPTLKGYMGAKSSDTDIETNSFTILPLEMDSNLDLQ